MALKRLNPILFVLLAWTGALAWLLTDDRYQLFLAPRFVFLIHASLAVSLLFVIGSFKSGLSAGKDQFIKGLILLLPLLYIASAGDSTLGNFALSKRTLVGPVQQGPAVQPDAEASTDQAQGIDGAGSNPSSAPPPLVSLGDLVRQWDLYNGKTVSVEGLYSASVVDHPELSAVFRYFINCCAADAMPVGVFLAADADRDLADDDWVRITGRVSSDKLDGFDVIRMDLDAIERRVMPDKNAAYIFE